MRLVLTLLVRDEADIVDAQVAFHLHAGVDFVIATDNRSDDATTEILEGYARDGVLHLIRESGDDLRQSEWVSRMASLAATEFAADWIINSDADEFWWPCGSGLKDILASVPDRYGVVRAAWRNFVPRPDGSPFFAERMTARLCTPGFYAHPLATHSKSAHRASADVRIGRGNHEAFADGLVPLRGWFPIEILHFPVRSLAHCLRKYVTQFVALEKNAEKGIPDHMADAYRAYQAGRLEAFYEPLVVGAADLEEGLATGRLTLDTRLRDALRSIRTGGTDDAPTFAAPRTAGQTLSFPTPGLADRTLYASEASVLPESDVALALGARADDLESRLARMERRRLAGLRRIARAGRA